MNKRKEILLCVLVALGQAVACTTCLLFLSDITRLEVASSIHFVVYGSLLLFGLNLVMMMYARREIDKHVVKNFIIMQTLLFIVLVLSEVMGLLVSPYLVPYLCLGICVSSLISKQLALYVNALLGVEIIVIGSLLGGFHGGLVAKAIITVVGGGLLLLLQKRSDSRIRTIGTAICVSPLYVGMLLLCELAGFITLASYTQNIVAVLINPILSVILAIGILPIFEWAFRILTAYRVAELGDVSKGMLYELSQKAKGTYYHSVSVANLTAECAAAIGEDSALARVCAMYHDIGKIVEPTLFIENQNEETGNPHDKMTPELSVALIRKHAKDGEEILKKHRVPEIIVECAVQHHGTLPIRFFYEKAKKFSAGEVNVADYSYDGTAPTSKIAAMIMICDASEAAVRAKGSFIGSEVDSVVKSIIEERMVLEQFDNSPITFSDLHIIRETIVASFAGAMHKRVKYPKFDLKSER